MSVTLKHPKAPGRPSHDLSIAPLFSLEGRRIPRHELPEGERHARLEGA